MIIEFHLTNSAIQKFDDSLWPIKSDGN